MTTKEIQIGNWLTDGPKGFPMFVQAIYGDDTVYLDFEENEGDTWETDIKDICPIPITKELLLNSGFTNKSAPDIYTYKEKVNGWMIDLFQMDDGNHVLKFFKGGNKPLKIYHYTVTYIHELQNAVRLITKQDLKIEI